MRYTIFIAARTRLLAATWLVGAAGCDVFPPPPPLDVQPDEKVVVTVVTDAYKQLERVTSVFLSADGVEGTTMARVRTALGDELASTFRPSSELISGDPGASIALGRFNLGDDGRLSVVASYVQEDGIGRGCTQYTLDLEDEDWVISEAADAWPDCPISTQGEETYRAAIERARGEDCLALGTRIGMCGPWLYVVGSNGYVGAESYYDPRTGLMVAQRQLSDVAESDYFTFGEVECEPTVSETIPCEPGPDPELCDVDSDCPPGICPDGSQYLRFSCADHVCNEVQYIRNPCEPVTTAWIECGEDFSFRGCDYSSAPVCGDDSRTYSNASEACCFVSRYQEGTCENGTASRADECRDGGGFWDCGGLLQCWYCNHRTTDAGEPCTDSLECDGECFADGLDPAGQECTDAEFGVCSATSVVFGCFCELYDGRGSGICVD